MNYKIIFRKSAKKQIESLQATDARKIYHSIAALAENPRPAACIKMKVSYDNAYRIVKIGDRKDVYE